MTGKTAVQLLGEAERWWSTKIIDIEPGRIAVRGYPIEQLIGVLSYPEMVWLMLQRTDRARWTQTNWKR